MVEIFDLDVLLEDKSGMEFIWFCKRMCEDWLIFDDNFDFILLFIYNCIYQDDVDKGCLKIDLFDLLGENNIKYMLIFYFKKINKNNRNF